MTGCSGSPYDRSGRTGATPLVLVRPKPSWAGIALGSAGDGPGAQRLERMGVACEIRALVRKLATANPLWGAPRIHGELRTLGVEVSKRTVPRLLTRVTRPVADVADLLDESPRVGRVDGLRHGVDAHGTGARRRRALPSEASERQDLLLFDQVQDVPHATEDYTSSPPSTSQSAVNEWLFWVSTEGGTSDSRRFLCAPAIVLVRSPRAWRNPTVAVWVRLPRRNPVRPFSPKFECATRRLPVRGRGYVTIGKEDSCSRKWTPANC